MGNPTGENFLNDIFRGGLINTQDEVVITMSSKKRNFGCDTGFLVFVVCSIIIYFGILMFYTDVMDEMFGKKSWDDGEVLIIALFGALPVTLLTLVFWGMLWFIFDKLYCVIRGHKWGSGCLCTRCGKAGHHHWEGCQCTRCGDERHSWGDWTYIDIASDLFSNRCKQVRTCKRCGSQEPGENHKRGEAVLKPCPLCSGVGEHFMDGGSWFLPCGECDGTGEVTAYYCPRCHSRL